ncbi:MAG: GNAT family protein [Candidatus Woesearchaeota archaeon]
MPNVMLRPLNMGDLDNMMQWVNDSEIIGNFAVFNKKITREEEQKFLEKIIASENDRTFAIETEFGEYLGNVGINQIHWPSKNGRLAIIIGHKDQHGKGYGQSAIMEALRVAFEDYKLHKIWLIVFEENRKARHVYEKCGFKVEGILREEYWQKGEYHNMVRMSILEDEFYKIKEDEKWN